MHGIKVCVSLIIQHSLRLKRNCKMKTFNSLLNNSKYHYMDVYLKRKFYKYVSGYAVSGYAVWETTVYIVYRFLYSYNVNNSVYGVIGNSI